MNLPDYTDKQLRDAYQYQFDLAKDPRPCMAILKTMIPAKKKMIEKEMDRRGMHWRISKNQFETIYITNSLN